MCANGGSSHCCQLLLYCPPKRRPHKATLGRPTWKGGQLKSLSLVNAHSRERERETQPQNFPLGKVFRSAAPSFLPSRSTPLSVSHLALSLFCSLTNHPYLNVCNGIGLMPLHQGRERKGQRYRDKGQVERWVSALMVGNDLSIFFSKNSEEKL